MSKKSALILIVAMTISCMTVFVADSNAQTSYAPLAPQFTVKYADHSYDVPPKTTTTTDAYTGKTTTYTEPGYHVKNFTLDVSIKNQQFPSSIDGNWTSLYYTVDIKGHFLDQWWADKTQKYTVEQSKLSDFTVFSIPANYEEGSELDIRVQVYLQVHYVDNSHIQPFFTSYPIFGGVSNTQTITILASSITTAIPSPTITSMPVPTITPNDQTACPTINNNQLQTTDSIPLTTFVTIVIVLVAIIAALTGALFIRKHKE